MKSLWEYVKNNLFFHFTPMSLLKKLLKNFFDTSFICSIFSSLFVLFLVLKFAHNVHGPVAEENNGLSESSLLILPC